MMTTGQLERLNILISTITSQMAERQPLQATVIGWDASLRRSLAQAGIAQLRTLAGRKSGTREDLVYAIACKVIHDPLGARLTSINGWA